MTGMIFSGVCSMPIWLFAAASSAQPVTASKAVRPGSVVQRDADVATPQAGPHHVGGETTGYSFFEDSAGFDLVFRKRALHPGAAIGYHRQEHDEIYYVVSRRGELTLDGEKSRVGAGTAILTRTGSSHGLRQVGDEDLVMFIVYRKP